MSEVMKKMKGTVTFSVFDNFAAGKNKTIPWDRFAASAVKSVGYDTKEQSIRRKAIIGGPLLRDGKSREDNVRETPC